MLPLVALVATSTPAIDVYTFGAGDDVFSHFGHSAICVAQGADDRCYNFGTADFATPLPLTRDFIRGRAVFWVSVIARAPMLAFYRDEDRTIIRQRLPLGADEARVLAADLAASARGDARYYRYHHYFDNCTTRIRDAVDRATQGRLRAAAGAARAADAPTLRAYTRRGFAAQPALLWLTALILGRRVDRPTDAWEAMFLPAELAGGLERALSATPVVEYTRRGPVPPAEAPPWEWALAGLGAALAAGIAAARAAGARRAARAVRGAVGLALALVALVPWGLALASQFPELRVNEVLLVLLPTDLALGFLGARALRLYTRARLVGLSVVLLLALFGVLIQPLAPLIVLAALPLLASARAQQR